MEIQKSKSVCSVKKALVGFFCIFSMFIQISFPGLTGSVMFLVKGFQSEEWMLMSTC